MISKKIESRDNPRLKLARKIRDGRISDRIFVEGVRLGEEAVGSDLDIDFCLFESNFDLGERQRRLLDSIREKGIEVAEVPKHIFLTITETKASQGIVLICSRPASGRAVFEWNVDRSKSRIPLVLVLTEVNNPSNLGAVIRSAEAAGAAGVVVTRNSADVFSPRSLRASMGSSFRIPVWENADIWEIVDWGKQQGKLISAASGLGSDVYTEVDWTKSRILFFGSEAHGVSKEVVEAAGSNVRIPIEPTVESLNLAVSASIILFEARRQVIDRA